MPGKWTATEKPWDEVENGGAFHTFCKEEIGELFVIFSNLNQYLTRGIQFSSTGLNGALTQTKTIRHQKLKRDWTIKLSVSTGIIV